MERQGKYPYYAIEIRKDRQAGYMIFLVVSEGLTVPFNGIRYQELNQAYKAAEQAGIVIEKVGTLYGII